MGKMKMKTHKSLAKRFKVTGTGKLMHWKAGKSHLLRRKSSKRRRRLSQTKILTGRMALKFKKVLKT